jgi:hypothetical protein
VPVDEVPAVHLEDGLPRKEGLRLVEGAQPGVDVFGKKNFFINFNKKF